MHELSGEIVEPRSLHYLYLAGAMAAFPRSYDVTNSRLMDSVSSEMSGPRRELRAVGTALRHIPPDAVLERVSCDSRLIEQLAVWR